MILNVKMGIWTLHHAVSYIDFIPICMQQTMF